jgi:hypothetical protein
MPILKQRRRTPWDNEKLHPLGRIWPSPFEQVTPPESIRPRVGRKEVFRLHGRCVFDPAQVTSQDLRQFLWAGLRLLRTEARARGLSDEQVQQLLVSAFEVFHDTAESMWTTLKAVVSKEESTDRSGTEVPAPADPFIACAEDRLVPVEMHYRERLTLLDPDTELLSSSEG